MRYNEQLEISNEQWKMYVESRWTGAFCRKPLAKAESRW
jgi:hypothetical protein